ncbi:MULTISPECIES: Fur family transcriptional regulator [Marinobacter]|uniref:Fur family transcriptional regulator n=1 Tax=Marinobacter nauticus TaxID=2743 RepID=A0A1M2UUA7_MARNT|nr:MULTISPECIES: Fur family transcriptional regulator [Marinobacter]MDX5439611.1 transcriptional repressor [Alteromonadaceae bacterium]OJS98872.1 Fur family transcriptional regulator [Marinobacter nauticus]QFS88869.1 Zinc uptake regulation protein [Marinobacter sp. THAF197a]QFT52654.1 Zinc uptake regulation protein [Marinobacter sp. THAF39]
MPERALPYRPHNHEACVSQALADARAICRQQNARLTPIRERVLELIWQSHKPLGAYDILAMLGTEGHNAAPPTVYRALDFLLQYGLVHRIASLNAFTGCTHAGEHHRGTFLICRQCSNVLELDVPEVMGAVEAAAAAVAFRPEEVTLEIAGLCPRCQGGSGHA